MNTNALILFFKYPIKGAVKTRITGDTDEDFVYNLYCHLVRDLFKKVRSVHADIIIATDNTDCGEYGGYRTLNQRGGDIGEKMYNAFCDVFSLNYANAVLTGSDIPELSADIINEAFRRLCENEIVIGPASDGGYYLIGFRRDCFSDLIFKDIRWSSPDVYSNTISRIKSTTGLLYTLETLNDIDTLEDLRSYYEKNRAEGNESDLLKFLIKNERVVYGKI